MEPNQIFRYCPRCGAECTPGKNPLTCPACSFCYFFNPTCAAGAYIFDSQGRAIFIERAKEPAKGKFAIPGGFIDIGETAEDALRREVREEVGLEIEEIEFLVTYPNLYHFRDVHYPVCDFIFTAKAVGAELAQALDGVAGFQWRRIDEIDPDTLAFPSLRKSWEVLIQRMRT